MCEFEMRNVRHEAESGEEPEVSHDSYLEMAHRLVSHVEGVPGRTGAKAKIENCYLQPIPEDSAMR